MSSGGLGDRAGEVAGERRKEHEETMTHLLSSAGATLLSGLIRVDAAVKPVLTADDGWRDGDGPWWPLRLIFTTLWIVLVIFLVRWIIGRRGGDRDDLHRARGVLAERYARGEITAAEYEERLERLR